MRTPLVWLVEDNRGDPILLRRSLTGRLPLLQLLHFHDGNAMFQWLTGVEGASLPDLILLDINLPMITGHAILERLKLMPGATDIPVIMLSSSSSDRDISQAYGRGACGYLVKPLSFVEYEYLAEGIAGVWTGMGFKCDPSLVAALQGYRKPLAA